MREEWRSRRIRIKSRRCRQSHTVYLSTYLARQILACRLSTVSQRRALPPALQRPQRICTSDAFLCGPEETDSMFTASDAHGRLPWAAIYVAKLYYPFIFLLRLASRSALGAVFARPGSAGIDHHHHHRHSGSRGLWRTLISKRVPDEDLRIPTSSGRCCECHWKRIARGRCCVAILPGSPVPLLPTVFCRQRYPSTSFAPALSQTVAPGCPYR